MIDVLVIGAGAAGLFAAAGLARAGLEVEVWEKRTDRAMLSRAIGVHAPALAALDGVGAAEPILAEAVRVRRAHARIAPVIGSGVRPRHVGTVSFDSVSRRFPFVATLPQHRSEALLEVAMRQAGAADVRYGLEVVGVAPDPRGVTVRGETSALAGSRRDKRSARAETTQTRARFVVVADGPESPARRRLGVRTSGRTYRDRYLMGDVADPTPDGEDAVVTLTPDGVVESFPLPGGVRRFVAHTPVLLPDAGPDVLGRLVATRTGVVLDPATATMVSAFGVRRSIAERFAIGNRIALVGDAAHEISPIGGQGMNLGWLDVAALVPVVVDLLRGDVGGDGLDGWSRERRAAAVAAARQAEVNMALSAPGSAVSVRARGLALARAIGGSNGARLARVYAMGGD